MTVHNTTFGPCRVVGDSTRRFLASWRKHSRDDGDGVPVPEWHLYFPDDMELAAEVMGEGTSVRLQVGHEPAVDVRLVDAAPASSPGPAARSGAAGSATPRAPVRRTWSASTGRRARCSRT